MKRFSASIDLRGSGVQLADSALAGSPRRAPRCVNRPLALFLAAFLLGGSLVGCDSERPAGKAPPPIQSDSAEAPAPTDPPAPSADPDSEPDPSAEPGAEAPPRPPWNGPFLVILRGSAGIYSEPTLARAKKIGYIQQGGRVPVKPEKVPGPRCSGGYYELVDGGYACSDEGTTNLDDPRVKNGPKQPDLTAILPYKYARNTKHGAPLYKSVPTKEQIEHYETRALATKPAPAKAAPPKSPEPKAPAPGVPADDAAKRFEHMKRRMAELRGQSAAESAAEPGPKPPGSEAADAGAVPWFQQEDPNLNALAGKDLMHGSDDVLAMRLLKGFYVAVSRVFSWQGRRYYQTTKGLTAPANYFHFVAGSDFHGVELDDTWRLPIGWVHGANKSRPKFAIDTETKSVKSAGSLKRLEAVNLTDEELKIGKATYVHAVDGFWVRKDHVRITHPGDVPEDVGPSEPWLDVNLSSQTIVAFRGAKPFYATLISSGKKHRDKEKDHSTPIGRWRVREKHLAATMDGDGTASDLPYSIEGVPYVMYFHRSYATHGAFWHQNYGVQMSHGCVNLAPLDAKYLFFHTEPPVPEGWSGSWSSDERLGSWVVVHD